MNRSSLIALLSVLSLHSTASRAAPTAPPSLEVDPVTEGAAAGSVAMSLSDGEVVHVDQHPLLTLGDFTSAQSSDRGGKIVLQLQLTAAAAARLQAYTAANIGKRLALLRDGHLLQAPRIRVAIQGQGLEVGPLDKSVARELVKLIGAPPR